MKNDKYPLSIFTFFLASYASTFLRLRTYDYGNITNSINFIPNSSGIYTYWNNAGGSSQIKASKLINEDMFTSLLGFNGTDIWDFTSLNMTKRVYPDLRWKTSSGK